MPWLLCRYLLREVLKVFAISASVLVLVTAFGAAIKPLAADDLIGPLQTAKYILLAIVPMLQFAIPFAAAFATTLVLHRMTTDNEVLAASVSGISYPRMLAPLAMFGAALLVIMIVLTQWIIPRFWGLMDRNLAADVTRVVMASIEKGVPFRVDRYQIYADRGRMEQNPEAGSALPDRPDLPRPVSRLHLAKVAAAELDPQGRIVTDVTARSAVIDVYRVEGRTLLMLALSDTVAFDVETGQLLSLRETTPDPFLVPGGLRDEPMFLTQGELIAAHRQPDVFTYVREARDTLAAAVQQREILRRVDERLATEGSVGLVQGAHRMRLEADGLAEGRFTTRDGRPVIVLQEEGGEPYRRFVTEGATITPSPDFRPESPAFDLLLGDCRVEDLRSGGRSNERQERWFKSCQLSGDQPANVAPEPLDALLARADGAEPAPESGAGPVASRATSLRERMEEIRLEIHARLQQRYAMSFTAFLLPMLGAVLAMWLRESLPLMIYLRAFAPSIVDVLLISGGDHMIRQGQVAAGIAVMWAGNAVLLAVLLYALRRLVRN